MFKFIENVARIGAESTEENGDNRYEHFFKHCIILYLRISLHEKQ
jgi:hypothetical protein